MFVFSKNISLNYLYLNKVNQGLIEDVKALFQFCRHHPKLKLNINTKINQFSKSALRVAIENRDLEMCELLLENKVKDGFCF